MSPTKGLKLMKTKKWIASALSLLATAAVLTVVPLVESAVAQTSSVVVVHGVKIATGSTPEGATNWRQCFPVSDCGGIPSVVVDVDTSKAGFTVTPNYVTSIGGDGFHGYTIGSSAVYNATPNGFSVVVHLAIANQSDLTPGFADRFGWHINWVGIGR